MREWDFIVEHSLNIVARYSRIYLSDLIPRVMEKGFTLVSVEIRKMYKTTEITATLCTYCPPVYTSTRKRD